MQYAGDAEGYYYAAGWDAGTVVKAGPFPLTTVVWTRHLAGAVVAGAPQAVAAVAVDEEAVYVMLNANSTVHILDRSTGLQTGSLALTGGRVLDGDLHGSLFVALGKVYHSLANTPLRSRFYRYDRTTGALDQTFETAEPVFGAAFDGARVCHGTSADATRVSCYRLAETNYVPAAAHAEVVHVRPTYHGPFAIDTQSHGAGFYPPTREYWYPTWPTGTVVRYDETLTQVGTFQIGGGGRIMQLAGDTDGYFYSADWDRSTVTKMGPFPQTTVVWTKSFGGHVVGGVAVDEEAVYAMRHDDNVVHVLDKVTGEATRTFQLSGGLYGRLFGGLAVVRGKLYYGQSFNSDEEMVYGRVISRHPVPSAAAGTAAGTASGGVAVAAMDHSFRTHAIAKNLVFNGHDLCLSDNSAALHCYELVTRPAGCG